ncbi:alpha/beta hydrolase, partial [Sphingosinicellaceae bacterium A1X5R2]|nr:alpha/beta hydrolase [Pedomonas mirosovicensis]
MLNRRAFLHGSLAIGVAAPALAREALRTRPCDPRPLARPPARRQRVTVTQRAVRRRLDSPPDDLAFYGITRPTLTLVRPASPNGMALLLVPGGGYERIATAPDGGPIAHHFAERGFLVGTLLYRLPYDGWAAGRAVAGRPARLPPAGAGERGRKRRWASSAFRRAGIWRFMLASEFSEQTYARVDGEDDRPRPPCL